jgi:hypothetical protein
MAWYRINMSCIRSSRTVPYKDVSAATVMEETEGKRTGRRKGGEEDLKR